MLKMNLIIKKYRDPQNPGAFSAPSGFIKNNNDLLKNIEKKNSFKENNELIKNTLRVLNSTTLHKPKRLNFKRQQVEVGGINSEWQIDLIEIQSISGSNFGNRYIFVCIDVFSKKAYALAIKNKEAKTCLEAFKKILKDSRCKPKCIYLDNGREFLGEFKRFCEEKRILILPTKSKLKACIAERFIRTLKSKMWRLFTFHSEEKRKFPKNITKYLKALLDSYNNSYHRTIKTTPNSVNRRNEQKIRKLMYDKKDILIKFKFKVGDYVRRAIEKELFTKGYIPGWEKAVYIIAHLYPTIPPTFTIKDLENSEYSHKFYAEELQLINFSFKYDTFRVLKEFKERLFVEKLNSDRLRNWVNKKKFLQ